MANKKKNNQVNVEAQDVQEQKAKQNVPKKKPTKKEKKEQRALAEQRSKELNKKKTRNYGIGFAFSLVALAVSFISDAEVGTTMWSYVQIGSYALMGIAGFFLKYGAKFEENAKRAKTMDMMGLIFIVLCLGMAMAEAVALLSA